MIDEVIVPAIAFIFVLPERLEELSEQISINLKVDKLKYKTALIDVSILVLIKTIM